MNTDYCSVAVEYTQEYALSTHPKTLKASWLQESIGALGPDSGSATGVLIAPPELLRHLKS